MDISSKRGPFRDGEDPKQFSNLEVSKRREAGRIQECTLRSHCNCTNLHTSFLSGEIKTTFYVFENLLNTCHETTQRSLYVQLHLALLTICKECILTSSHR